jgi:hypothetical protein
LFDRACGPQAVKATLPSEGRKTAGRVVASLRPAPNPALPKHYYAVNALKIDPVERNAGAEAFFAATGAEARHSGTRAYYNISSDFVQMPPFETFRDPQSYYATRGHETVHWTRHASRLAREFGRKRFGDEGYAMEEFVAELGAAFLCADLDLTPEVRDDHAAYIASWIQVLRNDKRAIFTAASHAQRAVDFLHGLQAAASHSGSGGVSAVTKPDILIIDGHGFSWQRLCELRREQLEAWRESQARQLTLFELKDDSRPSAERTALGRYEAPTFLDRIQDQ